jgi:hypothetical protein
VSRTTRVRIMSQPLHARLTRAQALMACDVGALYAAAAAITAGQSLSAPQVATLMSVDEALSHGMRLTAAQPVNLRARQVTAGAVDAMARTVAVEQRAQLASTVVNTLKADNWTVTVVDGGDPDRYTGIEATRGTEHLIAAVGPGELIADQAGAHDCGGTVDTLVNGLRDVGFTLTVADDMPHDGSGGSLYSLRGGPTRAHAIQAGMRIELAGVRNQKRRSAPPSIRMTAS